jgi:ketosteroid isomerase-like protein
MSTATPRALLARYHDAMLALDANALADLYAVDGVHDFPFLTAGRPRRYVGREEIRAGYGAAWGATPLRVEAISNVAVYETADPEVIIAEQDAMVVFPETGQRFAQPSILVMRARDGAFVHVRDYADQLRVWFELKRLPTLVARLEAGVPGSSASGRGG